MKNVQLVTRIILIALANEVYRVKSNLPFGRCITS